MKISFLLLTLMVATVGEAQLERIDAKDFFDEHAGPVVYIELADSQTLVFKQADNDEYVLRGRPLEIRAKNLELNGNVVVSAYLASDHAPDKTGQPATPAAKAAKAQGQGSGDNGARGDDGTVGTTGDPGNEGAPASTVRLFIGSATGGGVITFNAAGMKGGKGQQGGNGGNAGQGGKGHDRHVGESPGDGGDGGDGGFGGKGGPGGTGGRGGDILFASSICSLAPSIRLLSPKREGGDGGNAGNGGAAGGIGLGGDGSGGDGGHGGLNAGTDRQNVPGPEGDPGPLGSAGKIECLDCKTPPQVDESGKITCP